MRNQICRLQRKVHPFPMQTDAAMPGPVEKFISKHPLEIGQNLGCDGRMQAVAAEVHSQAGQIEAAGVAAHTLTALDYGDLEAFATRQFEGGAEARRAAAQHDYGRFGFIPWTLKM